MSISVPERHVTPPPPPPTLFCFWRVRVWVCVRVKCTYSSHRKCPSRNRHKYISLLTSVYNNVLSENEEAARTIWLQSNSRKLGAVLNFTAYWLHVLYERLHTFWPGPLRRKRFWVGLIFHAFRLTAEFPPVYIIHLRNYVVMTVEKGGPVK